MFRLIKTKHKYYILHAAFIISISIWGGFLVIPSGSEKDDPIFGLGVIIIAVIVYLIAFYYISKI